MACEDILSNCVYALAGSLGSVIIAFVAIMKAHSAQKMVEEVKK